MGVDPKHGPHNTVQTNKGGTEMGPRERARALLLSRPPLMPTAAGLTGMRCREPQVAGWDVEPAGFFFRSSSVPFESAWVR